MLMVIHKELVLILDFECSKSRRVQLRLEYGFFKCLYLMHYRAAHLRKCNECNILHVAAQGGR